MPRTLKRRSEVLDDDHDHESEPSPEPPVPSQHRRRRRRSSSVPSISPSRSPSSSSDGDTTGRRQTQTRDLQTLVKKLVRLALSTEYARLPLRRNDITQKILKDGLTGAGGGKGGGGGTTNQRSFKAVFDGAQKVLRHTFGMELVELPAREKTTLKDRRAQATQSVAAVSSTPAAGGGGGGGGATTTNKSWILVSALPAVYKRDAAVCTPARAPTREVEAEYTALYTFVVALVYLNNGALTDAKLERYLKRVNADEYTPVAGQTEKLLQRMAKEGYVEKRRDTSSGEETVEWVVGPRGKVEVGVRGVADLVKGVYGFGLKKTFGGGEHGGGDGDGDDNGDEGGEDGAAARAVKIEEDELNRRLERSLGVKLFEHDRGGGAESRRTNVDHEEQAVERPRNTRGSRRGNNADSDGD